MAKQRPDLAYWMQGAFLYEEGAKLKEVKGKLARKGWAEQRAFYRKWIAEEPTPEYVSQDPAERIAESIAPMREHEAAKEEARQNQFAATLWRHHALSGKEEALLLNGLRAKVLNALAYVLDSHPERAAEVAKDLREMAEDMERK